MQHFIFTSYCFSSLNNWTSLKIPSFNSWTVSGCGRYNCTCKTIDSEVNEVLSVLTLHNKPNYRTTANYATVRFTKCSASSLLSKQTLSIWSTCAFLHTQIHICTHAHTHMHTCTYTYAHMHIHICTHTCTIYISSVEGVLYLLVSSYKFVLHSVCHKDTF